MAVPNPDREATRLGKVLGKGLPPLVLISGASRFLRGEAFDRCLQKVPDDVDVRRIDGSDPGEGRELDDLLGAGLFGAGTWGVVRRGEAWLKAHGPRLVEIAGRIASGCGLLLEVEKLDRRTKAAKALLGVAEAFEFREPYAEPYDRSRSPLEAELVGWIERRAKAAGLALTPEAAFLLQSTVGSETAELAAEIRRLASAVGDVRRTLSPDDLREHLTVAFESTPFEFADAVLAHDRARAHRSLAAMFARGVRGRDGQVSDAGAVFPFVASWLWQSLSNVHAARLLLDAGERPDAIPGHVGVRTFVDRFRAQFEANPAPRLRRGLALLRRAQRELRLSGEDAELILERFLAGYFRKGAA